MNQFDLPLGEKLRDDGVKQVSEHNKAFISCMRAIADYLINRDGQTTTDDLRMYAEAHDIKPSHHNAWGCIFREKKYKAIGHIKSIYASNHAREIKIWTIKEG